MSERDSTIRLNISSAGVSSEHEIHALALNALSDLSRQFSQDPNFQSLIKLLVMTISGQFSIADVCILIQPVERETKTPYLFASGRFNRNSEALRISIPEELLDYFSPDRMAKSAEDIIGVPSLREFGQNLKSSGMKLIAPLISSNNLVGVVGMGDKVNKKPISDSDIILLRVLLDSITPLISYSRLFTHVSDLNTWFVEILNSVKHGVLVFDYNDKLQMVNEPGLKILKGLNSRLSGGELPTGLHISSIFETGPFPGWSNRFLKCRSGFVMSPQETMIAKQNGADMIFAVSVSLICDNAAQGSDMIVTLDDITEIKENEQQIFELQKHAEIGMLASSIAHELNNFLGMILGGIELLDMYIKQANPDKAKAALDQSKAFISQMARFTAGLMDMNKLTSIKQGVNINSLITNILSFVSVQKKFKCIITQVDIDQTVPLLYADRDQITQLILNLMSNAADAINDAHRANGCIIIKTTRESDAVNLSISDNGMGIKPDLREKLFKSRFTTKSEGHGYGLITCSKIIENHDALVAIDSTPGKGTTFEIRFPISTLTDFT